MRKTKIVFLILPELHLLDFAGPAQVFIEAQDYALDVALEYCSFDTSINCSYNIELGPLKHYSQVDIRSGDYLVIPGSKVEYLVSRKITAQHQLFEWIRSVHKLGAYVCSICTGAFLLAHTGLLNGRKCTTHWKRSDQLQNSFPKINLVEDVLFTEDDRVLTSAGVTAGIDLALHIVGKLKDEMTAYKVARELVVYLRRSGNESQHSIYLSYRNHMHSGVHRVQDYLQDNLQHSPALPDLSEVACMSTRNLTRIFKKEAGITINQYMNFIRKMRLRELVKNPDLTRKQLASLCGLKSERQVIRLLQGA